jgi:5-methylthioadenosine/S-adenosylhomocysteine deaminase
MSILIKNVQLDGEIVDILMEGNLIKKIGRNLSEIAAQIINGQNKAILPGLVNSHTHAAMTLLRGYADDLSLKQWLKEKIWPAEARLTKEDIYWGSKLACLEMIKSGTTCFCDMYWEPQATIKAVEEMGLRAFIGLLLIDFDQRGQKKFVAEQYEKLKSNLNQRITLTLGPHSIYTVNQENLLWAKRFASENNLLIQMHLSETQEEVDSCFKQHRLRPVEYLANFDFLGPEIIFAHAIWLNEKEIELLAKTGSSVVYNPTSNMKLASGILAYQRLKNAGVNILLGTDGVSSNNNLDLFEEMKFAALLQKVTQFDPTILPVKECFNLATFNASQTLKLPLGKIQEGNLADLILIDIKQPELVPNYNSLSNLIYAGGGSCVDTVICDGQVLMENRIVKGEEEIIEKCQEISQKL